LSISSYVFDIVNTLLDKDVPYFHMAIATNLLGKWYFILAHVNSFCFIYMHLFTRFSKYYFERQFFHEVYIQRCICTFFLALTCNFPRYIYLVLVPEIRAVGV
jgi:hypothetical protein